MRVSAGFSLLDFQLDAPVRLAKAHGLCLLALGRDEKSGFAYETLGLIYSWGESELARAGLEYSDPLECFQKAIAGDPTCDFALRYLAQDELSRGLPTTATELLERAVALDTKDEMVYQLLAVIYLGTRRFEDWQRTQQKAEWLAPEVALAPDYRERILALCGFRY